MGTSVARAVRFAISSFDGNPSKGRQLSMKNLYGDMARLLHNGESIVAATIFDKTGSAPRSEGSKMVVRSDGSIIGTIGGGRLEADTIKSASEVFLRRQSLTHSFDLTSEDAAGMAMICGGRGEVLLDYIDAGDETNLTLYKVASEILQRGGKAWLITALDNASPMPAERGQCLVKADGSMIGSLLGDESFIAKLVSGPGRFSIHSVVHNDGRFIVEPIRHGGTVYIFGAGHISQVVAPLAETVGFRSMVLDDRAEYANRARFAEPTEIRLLESFANIPDLGIDEDGYMVIVTRGHLHDKMVLQQVLRSRAAYIGMIGSSRKWELIQEALLKEDFDKQDLARVSSPIGMAIKAETPEEIAVSIVGELIKVRAEREQCGTQKK
jgi:xanthine dehydrogenase accessory factor